MYIHVRICKINSYVHTVNEETFCWAELSRYPQYNIMDFRGNTFAVQCQGTIIMFICRVKDS